MQRFRQMKSLQKFAPVHGSVYNHFDQERRLVGRHTYLTTRFAAGRDWPNGKT